MSIRIDDKPESYVLVVARVVCMGRGQDSMMVLTSAQSQKYMLTVTR